MSNHSYTIDDVNNIERTNLFQKKKILITVFINGNGLVLLDIMPQNVKITGECFAIEQRKLMIHFDNAPWHNSKFAETQLKSHKLRKAHLIF